MLNNLIQGFGSEVASFENVSWQQTAVFTDGWAVSYFPKKGTVRINPPTGGHRFIYSVFCQHRLLEILLNIDTEYEKAGERKTTVAVVKNENNFTSTAQEIANFERIYGRK